MRVAQKLDAIKAPWVAGSIQNSDTASPSIEYTQASKLSPFSIAHDLSASIENLVIALEPLEGAYLRMRDLQTTAPTPERFLSMTRALQAINARVSISRTLLCRALQVNDDELSRRYLPRTQGGFWFCRPETADIHIPTDFLRQLLQDIAKHHETCSRNTSIRTVFD